MAEHPPASRPRSSPPTSPAWASRSATVMDAGARVIHVDVMDGHFVPPITIGPAGRRARSRDQVHDAGGLLDVHLMIERPGAPDRRVRQGRRRQRSPSTPRRRRTCTTRSRDHGGGLHRRRGDLPGHARRRGRRGRRRPRPRAVHDRQPGLGRPDVHPALSRQGRAPARADRRRPGRSRSTAASTRPPPAPARRPARPCSSPAPPSSAPPIRPLPSARSRKRRGCSQPYS